jgi:hypothetical protein
VFQGLANNNGGMSASYNAPNCSNTYCHNPAGTGGTLDPANAGTGIAPSWNNPAYIADGSLKTDANCNQCHKSPGNPSFSLAASHTGVTIANDCAACHGHNGDATGAEGQRHMDGIRYANGSCDTCHGYPPMTQAQLDARVGAEFANAKLQDYPGGGGFHSSHLLSTVTAADGFTPCLPCHPSTSHKQGGSAVKREFVNVNDAADTTFVFDSTRTKRYNTETATCSNISCHFKPSPAWNL